MVLQFGFTLEHLGNVFYKQALEKFSLKEFEQADYSTNYYNDLKYISHCEEEHVKLLSGALTAAGVTYADAYVSNTFFQKLSARLAFSQPEFIAPSSTSKDALTVAGSILVTETLQTSMHRSTIDGAPMAIP
ncbi:hypothetical protein LTR56_027719 [Elasticomyces elasticus]|nr:hypothetical protein LTR56_027719 [Elasticomyces elasticus]KAK3614906.1 hypothetical protein LTR22_027632 [Elasticomyces elasticus]KAK4894124.1 hypothetical protein LTR49_028433 [Elasticomyces elasticus]KAK5746746.1 hypothetical protein LTS12_022643 [Elasticomyces elasticus]